ncbi:MAG: purine-nucleoside phosphorylase [Planctomycetota bacterium]
MLELRSQITETLAAIRERWDQAPEWGIVLGSGLGSLADRIDADAVFEYADLPHFPRTTAVGHRGRLICGSFAGRRVAALQGRFHLYEGWSAQQATFPIRVLHALGARSLLLSNAAGGLNPRFRVGDLMVIDDQINLMFANPLIGINDETLGPRFPDMSSPYCPDLSDLAMSAARRADIVCHRGVYVAMLGPTYETRAEYRACRQLGGDAVGMSTVPETIAAVHAGMRVMAISTITNDGSTDTAIEATAHDDVVTVANAAADNLTTIAREVISADAAGSA